METNNERPFLPRWIISILGVLLMVFVAILIVQKGHDLLSTIKNEKPVNTMSVSGDGNITASPDLATITLGVMSQGKDEQTVKNQNNDKVNKVIDFIKKQGIQDKDITTAQLSLYPQQDYNYTVGNTPVITGYQGNQSVTVKVHGVDKDTSKLNAIEDGAVNNGANEVNGVYFSFENGTLDNLKQQARKIAIDNAKQKAQDLAKEAGINLGKVVSVSETQSYLPTPMPYAMGLGGAQSDLKSVAPNIQTGSQDINESMTVVFEVK